MSYKFTEEEAAQERATPWPSTCQSCGATPRGAGYRDGSQGRPRDTTYYRARIEAWRTKEDREAAAQYEEGYHAGHVARQTMANLRPGDTGHAK